MVRYFYFHSRQYLLPNAYSIRIKLKRIRHNFQNLTRWNYSIAAGFCPSGAYDIYVILLSSIILFRVTTMISQGSNMQKIRVLILGGYGGAGSSISRLLLQETDCDIVVAGRHKARLWTSLRG